MSDREQAREGRVISFPVRVSHEPDDDPEFSLIRDATGRALDPEEIVLALNAFAPLSVASETEQHIASADWTTPRSYLTDDRDQRGERHKLMIQWGNNGDWYVSVIPEGYLIGPTVRLCTSGGASSRCPGLTKAISDAYQAMPVDERVRKREEKTRG
jgi:hypothetical protein